MKWYRITSCPNYAISEDGKQVKNITTDKVLNHNTNKYASDKLRRITLRRKTKYLGVICSRPIIYTLESLKQYINENNLI